MRRAPVLDSHNPAEASARARSADSELTNYQEKALKAQNSLSRRTRVRGIGTRAHRATRHMDKRIPQISPRLLRSPALDRRQRILVVVDQPLTATQCSARARVPRSECCAVLRRLHADRLVVCLNPGAVNHRVYWLTARGAKMQASLYRDQQLDPPTLSYPELDWELYGRTCSTHRSLVIRALREPMQPSRIRLLAKMRDATIRMSGNNARDAIRFLHEQGVVRQVPRRKRSHPVYELTPEGKKIQWLQLRANRCPWPK